MKFAFLIMSLMAPALSFANAHFYIVCKQSQIIGSDEQTFNVSVGLGSDTPSGPSGLLSAYTCPSQNGFCTDVSGAQFDGGLVYLTMDADGNEQYLGTISSLIESGTQVKTFHLMINQQGSPSVDKIFQFNECNVSH